MVSILRCLLLAMLLFNFSKKTTTTEEDEKKQVEIEKQKKIKEEQLKAEQQQVELKKLDDLNENLRKLLPQLSFLIKNYFLYNLDLNDFILYEDFWIAFLKDFNDYIVQGDPDLYKKYYELIPDMLVKNINKDALPEYLQSDFLKKALDIKEADTAFFYKKYIPIIFKHSNLKPIYDILHDFIKWLSLYEVGIITHIYTEKQNIEICFDNKNNNFYTQRLNDSKQWFLDFYKQAIENTIVLNMDKLKEVPTSLSEIFTLPKGAKILLFVFSEIFFSDWGWPFVKEIITSPDILQTLNSNPSLRTDVQQSIKQLLQHNWINVFSRYEKMESRKNYWNSILQKINIQNVSIKEQRINGALCVLINFDEKLIAQDQFYGQLKLFTDNLTNIFKINNPKSNSSVSSNPTVPTPQNTSLEINPNQNIEVNVNDKVIKVIH